MPARTPPSLSFPRCDTRRARRWGPAAPRGAAQRRRAGAGGVLPQGRSARHPGWLPVAAAAGGGRGPRRWRHGGGRRGGAVRAAAARGQPRAGLPARRHGGERLPYLPAFQGSALAAAWHSYYCLSTEKQAAAESLKRLLLRAACASLPLRHPPATGGVALPKRRAERLGGSGGAVGPRPHVRAPGRG